ncbi:hypothetical protein HZB90_00310, partial [archaeon]|nr:hypothetical protein [archaeon]
MVRFISGKKGWWIFGKKKDIIADARRAGEEKAKQARNSSDPRERQAIEAVEKKIGDIYHPLCREVKRVCDKRIDGKYGRLKWVGGSQKAKIHPNTERSILPKYEGYTFIKDRCVKLEYEFVSNLFETVPTDVTHEHLRSDLEGVSTHQKSYGIEKLRNTQVTAHYAVQIIPAWKPKGKDAFSGV